MKNKPVAANPTRRVLNKLDPDAVAARARVTTIIDAIPPDSLIQSIKRAPSLRGMILGYVAEQMFEQHVPIQYPDILSEHIEFHDDHNRELNKSDRTVSYGGRQYGIQLKSIQTNSIARNVTTGDLDATVQNDASDRRAVQLRDGTKFETTCYLRGEYDILAVPLFPFTGDWTFAYKRNRDCRPCKPGGRCTPYQAEHLLSTTETLTWPLSNQWTTDLLSLLDDTIGSIVGQPKVLPQPGGEVRVVDAAAVILPSEHEEI